ncbi:4Fe-4S dicluster domain-containing protein [Calderihabitans maritimus]|uniref:4Fe-4S dicluster domain-containing protein n=1 Tax=Calderihabitans maritimus TaxID=1246530 RepID=UPI00192D1929|nr:4Fe-4S dicluster domain-containing protein [Calderihabitans maritimus]
MGNKEHNPFAWVVGGLLAYAGLDMVKGPGRKLLRPPGAVPEKTFLGLCLRCGKCAQACPYRAIKIAGAWAGASSGTPYITARKTPCYLCEDFHCIKACSSGALREVAREEVAMGTARINQATCIAWQGMRCEVCYRRCPFMGKAIVIERFHNYATGKHAVFGPVVKKEHCVGCGICEHVCITDVPSITVTPR